MKKNEKRMKKLKKSDIGFLMFYIPVFLLVLLVGISKFCEGASKHGFGVVCFGLCFGVYVMVAVILFSQEK